MLLEKAHKSMNPIKRIKESHFKIFDEFRGASYAKRYELLCLKLVREQLYDAACLLLSDRDTGPKGNFTEPSEEINFQKFIGSLIGHTIGHIKAGGS